MFFESLKCSGGFKWIQISDKNSVFLILWYILYGIFPMKYLIRFVDVLILHDIDLSLCLCDNYYFAVLIEIIIQRLTFIVLNTFKIKLV